MNTGYHIKPILSRGFIKKGRFFRAFASGIMTFQAEKNASKFVGMDIANKHVFPYT